MALLALSLLFLIPFLFLFLKYKAKQNNKLNLPPGPRPLPFIGNLHQLGDHLHVSTQKMSKIHGPIIQLRLGQVPAVVVSSPALAKVVLKTQDLACCSRPPQVANMKYTYNGRDVGAAPYGDSWRNLRKLFVIELLSVKKLRDFETVRQQETDRLIQFISTRPNPNEPVDLTDLVFATINNFVFRVAFGYKSGGFGDKGRIHRLLEEVNAMTGRTFFAEDFFPGFGWIDVVTGLRRRLERSVKGVDEFLQEVIDKHMDVDRKVEGYDEDFVDVMIKLWKEGNSDFTLEHVKGLVLDVLFAGTDTTSTTIIWTLTDLLRHPDAMKKAQDEVRSVIEKKDDKVKVVEQTDLNQMHYLKLVINESMRLHSQVLIPRLTMQDCKIDGYDVPAKTWLFVNSWAIGRDEDTWQNAEEFVPERFVGSAVEYKGNNFEFLPFGGGRRICPGINFGVASVELLLAKLLYAFDWELPPGTKREDVDVEEDAGFLIRKKFPLRLVARNKKLAG